MKQLMKKRMKQLIKKIAADLGYSIREGHYTNNNLMEELYGRFPMDSLKGRKFYNIGSSKFRHKYWTNVDLIHDVYNAGTAGNVDIEYDLTKNDPLPIDTNSAECVYTSHTIEHVWEENTKNLFNEVYRVLKPNGIFRVTCPDIDLAINAYSRSDMSFFKAVGATADTLEEALACYCSSVLDEATPQGMTLAELKDFLKNSTNLHTAVNILSRKSDSNVQKKNPGNHVNWFNKDKIIRLLNESGFKKTFISGQQQSVEPVLRDYRYFDSTSPLRSLYVDAVK